MTPRKRALGEVLGLWVLMFGVLVLNAVLVLMGDLPQRQGLRRVDLYPGGRKRCNDCGEDKPVGMFALGNRSAGHRSSYCGSCASARTARWTAENPDRQRANARRGAFRRKYGLTPEAYDALLAEQGGVCASCGGVDPRNRRSRDGKLFVDHVKGTQIVCGLLCNTCNLGIGRADHDPQRLNAIADYLERRSRS